MSWLLRRTCWLLAAMVAAGSPLSAAAKSYSSHGGHSYSSHSSSGSHSFSSGGSHSFSSGGSRSSGSSSGSSKSYHSSSGKSYGSGSTWSDNSRHSYSSGKSYTSGSGHTFSSSTDSGRRTPATAPSRNANADSSSSRFAFDTAAAHARKEEASKAQYTQFKEAQRTPSTAPAGGTPSAGTASYQAKPPPLPVSGGGGYGRRSYIPDSSVFVSRQTRIYNVFNPYWSRPVVVYQDPYNSFFWWWLLDRSLDDRAWWAYHHRYDMDPARYQALVANDQQLEARVEQLEAQQPPRDPSYTPPGLDRDLMYSDKYVDRAYSNRPTTSGAIAFWFLAIPLALGVSGFFIWLIWFKRWQTTT